jgi:hypothetical protein
MANNLNYKKMKTIKQTSKPLIYCLLILFIILWNINCFGQDSICHFNNTCIYGKVIEISDAEIKYKKADFIEGPAYIIDRYEISYIRFSNGKCDSFPEVKPWFRPQKKTVHDTIKVVSVSPTPNFVNDPNFNKIQHLHGETYTIKGRRMPDYKVAKYLIQDCRDKQIKQLALDSERNRKLRYIGFLAIPAGIVGLVGSAASGDPSYIIVGGLAAGVSLGVSISNTVKQKKNIKQAIKLYNQKY